MMEISIELHDGKPERMMMASLSELDGRQCDSLLSDILSPSPR